MTNEKNNLENIVETRKIEHIPLLNSQIPPLEEYVKNFTHRYKTEKPFRNLANDYLKLKPAKKFKLRMLKFFKRSEYERETNDMLRDYAIVIRESAIKAQQALIESEQLTATQEEFEKQTRDLTKTKSELSEVEKNYQTLQFEKQKALEQLEREFEGKRIEEENKKQLKESEVISKTDTKSIIKEQLTHHVTRLPLFKVASTGDITFDDKKFTEAVEDFYLEDVINEIEKDPRQRNFLSKTQNLYDGVISFFDEIEDLSEIPNIEWTESIIYSRTQGYRFPTFPYMIVGKPEPRKKRYTVDAAIDADTSGSTNTNNRFEMIKKTSLATHSLMRKLNPKNSVYMSHFNNENHPISTTDLIKNVYPGGGTRIDLALDWLLDTLKDHGPSLAYLITDGEPTAPDGFDPVKLCCDVARKFPLYPNVMLRIWLIDGNKSTEEKIRKIGLAAGRTTKVIPVKNYMLANGMIKDVSDSFREMYDIDKF